MTDPHRTPVSTPIGRPRKALPVWLHAREARARVGISHRRLKQLADRGFVRRCKLGDTQQSEALYRSDDILGAMDAIATGRTPRRRLAAAKEGASSR